MIRPITKQARYGRDAWPPCFPQAARQERACAVFPASAGHALRLNLFCLLGVAGFDSAAAVPRLACP